MYIYIYLNIYIYIYIYILYMYICICICLYTNYCRYRYFSERIQYGHSIIDRRHSLDILEASPSKER